ncbi:hypothetical protein MKW98_031351 [Papaver atlanticum]|uniref:HXXXD-type acyl-transferase family protein n=1 Tax=Papaver atlanticum TaxID=357466 RepID=A0AAD4S537_9MAGN|nr:hypothetical protein MKW98_031351 [Papaver atlanticum]
MSNSCPEVRYISTDVVRPATYCSSSKASGVSGSDECIELSKGDIMVLPLGYMQRGLLYSCKEEDKKTVVPRLKTSLALDHFFPLAGRLAVRKHNNVDVNAKELAKSSVYIDCNSAGAEFIHAIADDISISNILDPVYVPRVVHESLFSLNGVLSYEGLSKPLLSIQVTELIDGVFIGCSMNHSVCDGTSLWHFINSWSEISREASTKTTTPGFSSAAHHISRVPFLKRWFPESAGIPIQLPFSIDCESFKETYVSTTAAANTSQLESKCFHFTTENIARLKAKANLCIPAENTTSTKISSLQALLAHFWVAITRARRLDQDDETTYLVAMGNRDRLKPPVCNEYFGNLTSLGRVTVKVGELLERGIGWGAGLLNQVIMFHNDEAIRSSWDSWIENPIPFVPPKRTITPSSSSKRKHSMLLTGSSPRFNMYGNDFGWGRPIAVRTGNFSKKDGVLSANPGPNEGSMEIEACLSVETFEALESNAEFMGFVTVLPPYESIQS